MAHETKPKGRGWIYSGAILAALIVLFFWLRYEFRDRADVIVARANYQDIISTESTNGEVVPVDDFQAYALTPGVVSKIYVKVGQQVAKGQELVHMDDSQDRSQLASANAALIANQTTLQNMQSGGTAGERITQRANISAAQSLVTNDRNQLATQQSLMARGAASANEVEAAKQRLAQDQAHLAELQSQSSNRYESGDIRSQQAQVANARQSVAAAENALTAVDIHSPINGTVYSIPVSQYDFVQTGEALMNVANLNNLKVNAYFDEPEVGSLKVGQKVTIVWDAKPDRVWHGTIEQAPTTIIAYGTRHVGKCVISVDDNAGDLLPNTNVTVTVTTSEVFHVLSIPREALHTLGNENYVFTIVKGHLHKITVGVGALNLTRVQITSGLQDGEIVVLGAASDEELTDGLEVKAQQ
jgi:HlyD family secretion protein